MAPPLPSCSVVLIELSLYLLNTMFFFLLLAFPDWIALRNVSKCLIHVPSTCIMHADGNGIDSTGATLLSRCRARVDLFVFFRVSSQLDNAKGYRPKGCFKPTLTPKLRLVAT